MRAVIGIGIEEEDRKHTWMEDADSVSAAPWAGARGAAGGPVGWGSGGGRWHRWAGDRPPLGSVAAWWSSLFSPSVRAQRLRGRLLTAVWSVSVFHESGGSEECRPVFCRDPQPSRRHPARCRVEGPRLGRVRVL